MADRRISVFFQSIRKRYYLSKLLLGIVFWVGIGYAGFLFFGFLESRLWLSTVLRRILFFSIVVTYIFLLCKWVAKPLLLHFGIIGKLDFRFFAQLVGDKFGKVEDKLLNILELESRTDELSVMAAKQKFDVVDTLPLKQAIDFSKVYRGAVWLLLPLFVSLLLYLLGSWQDIKEANNRLISFNEEFVKPAPFAFELVDNDLTVLRGENLEVLLSTKGDIVPESVFIELDSQLFLMKGQNGLFSFTLEKPMVSGKFRFEANGFFSQWLSYTVLQFPVISELEVQVSPPSYTREPQQKMSGITDLQLVVGSTVAIDMKGSFFTKGYVIWEGDSIHMDGAPNSFNFKAISSVNQRVKLNFINGDNGLVTSHDFEIKVIEDSYPIVEVNRVDNQGFEFIGFASDDYGVERLEVVVMEEENDNEVQRLVLGKSLGFKLDFNYVFPSGLSLKDGVNYKLYFEVKDNDGRFGGKVRKSRVFDLRLLTRTEMDNQIQQELFDNINKLERSNSTNAIEDLRENLGQNEEFNFEQRLQVTDFLNRQKEEENLMDRFRQNLMDKSPLLDNNELLKERLDRLELEAQKNEKLRHELEKLLDSFDKEQIQERVDELAKNQKSSKRNLSQLLELTKRYLITERLLTIAKNLEDMSRLQDSIRLGGGKDFIQKQSLITNEVDRNREGFEQLIKDNNSLQKPLDIGVGINEFGDLDILLKKIEGNVLSGLAPSVQASMSLSSEKMKDMADRLREALESQQGSASMAEDAEMLRQILENLIDFSMEEEVLMERTLSQEVSLDIRETLIREQQKLLHIFQHVDDSLFALSLRVAEISERVNDNVEEVKYNLDKTQELLSQGDWFLAASKQQYVVSASNSLADLLVNILDNMQMSMQNGQGEGGSGFQLPDIIQAQGKMGAKGQNGSQGQEQGHTGEGKPGPNGKNEGSSGNEGSAPGGEGGISNQGQGLSKGKSQNTMGNGVSESELQELFELFKEQQSIRAGLEQQLDNMISNQDKELAKTLVEEMKALEQLILTQGWTYRTQNKSKEIAYELLKLKNAELSKGQSAKRESRTSKDLRQEKVNGEIGIKTNQPQIELLKRDVIPMNNSYRARVKMFYDKKN